MPQLSEFGDVEELDNRYIDKCVVYVEGEDDRAVWERIVGNDLANRLEFKVPHSGGAGSDAVLARVTVERRRNGRIYGLVDGEVAARFGQVASLIECSGALFVLELGECDGICFLGAHELENVLVCHTKLSEFVENNVNIKELGSRNREEIEKEMAKLARRFYVAALLKYASAELYFRGIGKRILDVGHFRSSGSLLGEIRRAKEKIWSEFPDDGGEFRRQLLEICHRAKRRMKSVEEEGGEPKDEVARLADGKGLLVKLRERWKFTTANEGLLVQRVCGSVFAEDFRSELLAVTKA